MRLGGACGAPAEGARGEMRRRGRSGGRRRLVREGLMLAEDVQGRVSAYEEFRARGWLWCSRGSCHGGCASFGFVLLSFQAKMFLKRYMATCGFAYVHVFRLCPPSSSMFGLRFREDEARCNFHLKRMSGILLYLVKTPFRESSGSRSSVLLVKSLLRGSPNPKKGTLLVKSLFRG